ncbi:MAG: hypothetical protein R3F43_26755 [bacterium]
MAAALAQGVDPLLGAGVHNAAGGGGGSAHGPCGRWWAPRRSTRPRPARPCRRSPYGAPRAGPRGLALGVAAALARSAAVSPGEALLPVEALPPLRVPLEAAPIRTYAGFATSVWGRDAWRPGWTIATSAWSGRGT